MRAVVSAHPSFDPFLRRSTRHRRTRTNNYDRVLPCDDGGRDREVERPTGAVGATTPEPLRHPYRPCLSCRTRSNTCVPGSGRQRHAGEPPIPPGWAHRRWKSDVVPRKGSGESLRSPDSGGTNQSRTPLRSSYVHVASYECRPHRRSLDLCRSPSRSVGHRHRQNARFDWLAFHRRTA